MKKSITISFCLIIWSAGFGQNPFIDSVRQQVKFSDQDTVRILATIRLSQEYMFSRPDSSIIYGTQAIRLADKLGSPKYSEMAMALMARAYRSLGNNTKALQLILNALTIAEAYNLVGEKAMLLMQSGDIYASTKKYKKALEVLWEAKVLFDSLSGVGMSANTLNYIGQTYLLMGRADSALFFFQSAYNSAVMHQLPPAFINKCLVNLGKVQAIKGNSDAALKYYFQSRQVADDPASNFSSCFQIANLYKEIENRDSSAYYAQLSLEVALENGLYQNIIDGSMLLSDLYESTDFQKALQYNKLASSYKDSLYAMSENAAIEGFTDFDKREQQHKLETAEAKYKNRLRINAFLGTAFTLLIIAILLIRNNRNMRKAKRKVEEAFDKLKSTQSQLIQSEKMASLGELTAGIAHEIQNPLNFVNNFSEVNKELVEELEQEVDRGKTTEVKALAKDIKENQEKILHHGKRADAIVKGMLQHSRTSSGQKEPIDINALCDEYIRLSYHGLRAKDKTFNAKFETDFDTSLPKIDVVPQDIGRVVLNLINNAFYAVSEKQKTESTKPGSDYEPTVTVNTKKFGDKIRVSVKDNGNGIPGSIKEKIFQPFFTTKPAGLGTGLGLSLSYDIVKAHGGELAVETREGEGSEFVVSLPV